MTAYFKWLNPPNTKICDSGYMISESNQKSALEWKILKLHLQGLWAEANTLVKWSFAPVWETYCISLEQLSWAKVFGNVNKDRRKYCRSVYYRKISVQMNATVIFLKCQERENSTASALFGSKWAPQRRTAMERRQESHHNPQGGVQRSLLPIRRVQNGSVCSWWVWKLVRPCASPWTCCPAKWVENAH